MNKSTDIESKLQTITTDIQALAQSYQGDSLALLALLRCLEALHREIREGVFQESLPNSRHGFHALLKDIESEGGWPYIERMKLQALINNWFVEDKQDVDASATIAASINDSQSTSD